MPSITSTFRSNDSSLSDVLRGTHAAIAQIPNFQRGLVLDKDHVYSSLAGILLSNPVGGITKSDSGREDGRVQLRMVAGIESIQLVGPIDTDGNQAFSKTFCSNFNKVESEEDYRSACKVTSKRYFEV